MCSVHSNILGPVLLDQANQQVFMEKKKKKSLRGGRFQGDRGEAFLKHGASPLVRPGKQACSGSLPTSLPCSATGPLVGELEEGLGVGAVRGVAGGQRLGGRGLPVRVRGGRVRALAGAAARLRARAGLFHFPSLGQRGLVDILQAKPLSLVFVKGLGEERGKP